MGTVEKRNKHKKRRFVSSEEKLERELKDCMHCRFFWGHNNRCANGTCCKPSKKKEQKLPTECVGCPYYQGKEKAMDYINLLHASGMYEKQTAKIIPFRSIDIFENAVSAGTGNFLVDGPKETIRIDASILPEDTTFGVRISGDSMEPEFHDGQIAWVLQQESVANGEIGIFALNGEAYIKKLQNDKDGIFLISLNEKYAPIKVSENDRLDIFGKVLGKSDASAITGHC